ncbi:MAG: signal peptidase II [Fusicatenibacter sp.]|nr:signal peptidase II [Fusicatenibacter sp.]
MNSKYMHLKAAVCSLAATMLLFLADQYTKLLAVRYLKDQASVVLIPGVLELKYLENRGAAFGILQNQYWLFAVLTIIYLAVVLYVFLKLPKTGYYVPVLVVLVMLTAGALGNFYDRFTNHYVVDFIYFSLIDFPIFNVADIYVVVSVLLFLLLYLFHYKEEDFSFLFHEKQSAGNSRKKE